MNALQGTQTSGNIWPDPPRHNRLDRAGRELARLPESRQGTELFEDLERQMAAFVVGHEATLDEVRKRYVLPSDSSVTDFLKGHRTLPQLLLQAVPYLSQYFGNVAFSLRAVSDEYGWQTLYAVAMWPGKAHDAVVALDQFEDGWWIANSRIASGSLNFTYELV
jgi:hypothetical protein